MIFDHVGFARVVNSIFSSESLCALSLSGTYMRSTRLSFSHTLSFSCSKFDVEDLRGIPEEESVSIFTESFNEEHAGGTIESRWRDILRGLGRCLFAQM